MLSKQKIKLFNSLSHKKFRDELNLFVAEGDKLVSDLFPHFSCAYLVAAPQWLAKNSASLTNFPPAEIIEIDSTDELRKISSLTTPQQVYAVFRRPELPSVDTLTSANSLILALDTIQDPGNLGTILRTADWFGITDILCSETTADIYNPKVIQSSMGAIANVRLHYVNLPSTLKNFQSNGWTLYGTLLNGVSIYNAPISASRSILIMGNEGNGISPEVASLINAPLLIPSFHTDGSAPVSDSLNVAIATSIALSEFRRR